MGYLTTITIYNDGLDEIEKHPAEFAKIVYDACSGTLTRYGRAVQVGLGSHSNLITVQPPKHADNVQMYMHIGNCLFNANGYSNDFQDMVEKNPKFAKEIVERAKQMIEESERYILLNAK